MARAARHGGLAVLSVGILAAGFGGTVLAASPASALRSHHHDAQAAAAGKVNSQGLDPSAVQVTAKATGSTPADAKDPDARDTSRGAAPRSGSTPQTGAVPTTSVAPATTLAPTKKTKSSLPPHVYKHPVTQNAANQLLSFHPKQRLVSLAIPGPGKWTLFVNEPDTPGQTVVGMVSGTSGTLRIPYPADFCGVLQADVWRAPATQGPGLRTTIYTCDGPSAVPRDGGATTTSPREEPAHLGVDSSSPHAATGRLVATVAPNAAAPSSPTSALAFTGFGTGLQVLTGLGLAFVLAGSALLALRKPRRWQVMLRPEALHHSSEWILCEPARPPR